MRTGRYGRLWRSLRGKDSGSVGNVMITGIFVLAMTVTMLAFLDDIRLIRQQSEVTQIAREYILRMETEGSLTAEDRAGLVYELGAQGVTEIDLSGTTLSPVAYGDRIVLLIQGKLEGKYDITEKRVSTAKY